MLFREKYELELNPGRERKRTMETMQTFTQTVRIEQSDCDFRNQMMPAALLRKAQQIAIDHCNAVGLDGRGRDLPGVYFLLCPEGRKESGGTLSGTLNIA